MLQDLQDTVYRPVMFPFACENSRRASCGSADRTCTGGQMCRENRVYPSLDISLGSSGNGIGVALWRYGRKRIAVVSVYLEKSCGSKYRGRLLMYNMDATGGEAVGSARDDPSEVLGEVSANHQFRHPIPSFFDFGCSSVPPSSRASITTAVVRSHEEVAPSPTHVLQRVDLCCAIELNRSLTNQHRLLSQRVCVLWLFQRPVPGLRLPYHVAFHK